MSTTYQRPFVATLAERFAAERPLIQVLAGPRQVGKTTGVRQLMAQGTWPQHYANADDVLVSDRNWLLEQWQKALLLGDGALLVIDEIQKVANWPETIKELLQHPGQVFYWRERNDEVDFVYQYRDALYAIEVKSGPRSRPRA